jgi:hypothetical protein
MTASVAVGKYFAGGKWREAMSPSYHRQVAMKAESGML